MRQILPVLLVLGFTSLAQAAVWKWVDANGDVHFVDSRNPIYTWVDERGDVYYSDTPEHEDAVPAEFVWVSPGSLRDVQSIEDRPEDEAGSSRVDAGETPEQRAERERAEAYYCRRATEIHESYVNAPRLYRIGDDGERVYLDEEEAAQTLEETRARRDELCRPVS
ncbi:MAG: DUF4124 domain-containing protein [Proteobacteria bacterium]|nr:DUF4124 domain-containing protein [Pseudomonadota bacterium]